MAGNEEVLERPLPAKASTWARCKRLFTSGRSFVAVLLVTELAWVLAIGFLIWKFVIS